MRPTRRQTFTPREDAAIVYTSTPREDAAIVYTSTMMCKMQLLAVGGDGNAPASTIWFRSPPRQVPHVEIPPPLDDEPPFSVYSEYLDSELEELEYY